jgi:GNAT superfamily N-acetyltransferase
MSARAGQNIERKNPVGEIIYRLATVADLESLVDLRAAFLAEVRGDDPSDPQLLSALRQYFASSLPTGEFVSYVAEVDRRLVATSGMAYHSHPPASGDLSGRHAYIMNMYTLPTWRGRGVATTLFTMLLALAGKEGCNKVSLHALPLGRPIYIKAGFMPAEGEMSLKL